MDERKRQLLVLAKIHAEGAQKEIDKIHVLDISSIIDIILNDLVVIQEALKSVEEHRNKIEDITD